MLQNSNHKENETEEIDDWRNEHGDTDIAYLRSLATTGTIESLNKLKLIAEDLDVALDPSASADDIIDRIRMAVAKNEDGNPNDTN